MMPSPGANNCNGTFWRVTAPPPSPSHAPNGYEASVGF